MGRTPNPCVRCNEKLKFAPLVRFAEAIGADALATGHYARLVAGGPADAEQNWPRLLRAVDRDKDQSYFLVGVATETFANVRFPLGDKTKAEVRAIARRPGSPTPTSRLEADRFIPDGATRGFVEAHGGAGRPGAIVDEAGATLAVHQGTHHFTVGSGAALPAAGSERLFVVRIDAASGKVVVGPRDSLARSGAARLRRAWLRERPPARASAVRGCRSATTRRPCRPDRSARGGGAPAALTASWTRLPGVAPGQAAVFYDGEGGAGAEGGSTARRMDRQPESPRPRDRDWPADARDQASASCAAEIAAEITCCGLVLRSRTRTASRASRSSPRSRKMPWQVPQ